MTISRLAALAALGCLIVHDSGTGMFADHRKRNNRHAGTIRPGQRIFERLEERSLMSADGLLELSMLPAQIASGGVTTAAVVSNRINSAGFESGLGTWTTVPGATIQTTTSQAHSGLSSAKLSNRTANWHGAYQTLSGSWTNGQELGISAWLRTDLTTPELFNLTLKQVDSAGTKYISVASDTIAQSWTQLVGSVTLQITGTLSELTLQIHSSSSLANFYVDDVEAGIVDWESAANARIEQYRKSDGTIRIVDQFGNTVSGATVEIHQTTSDFAFGTAINNNVLSNATYAAFAGSGAFNWVTFEYETVWGSSEPTRGTETYFVADAMRNWAEARGLNIRGHNIFWSQSIPGWQNSLSSSEIWAEMQDRITNVVTRYRDDFLHWDVFNEPLRSSRYRDLLGDSIVTWMFQRARQLDPDGKLFVNEYNIMEGPDADNLKAHILKLLADGGEVDGIGVQGHFPGKIKPYEILSRLDLLSDLNIPIWATEFDVADPDEFKRADELEKFYRTAFSHPSMEGIVLWDFWAGSASRDPNRALMDVNGRINAAGQRFLDLRAEWTTNISTTAATGGVYNFRGFHGDYNVTITLADGTRINRTMSLDASNPSSTLSVAVAVYPTMSVVSAGDDAALNGNYSLQLSAANYVGSTQAASFTYQVDWNNDGVIDQSVNGGSNVTIQKTFTNLGAQTFQVRVQDARGAVTAFASRQVAVTGFQLVTVGSTKNLVWSGTFGQDIVTFTRLTPTVVQADVFSVDGVSRGLSYGFEGVTGSIITNGLTGTDQITTKTLNLISATDETAVSATRESTSENRSLAVDMSLAPTPHEFGLMDHSTVGVDSFGADEAVNAEGESIGVSASPVAEPREEDAFEHEKWATDLPSWRRRHDHTLPHLTPWQTEVDGVLESNSVDLLPSIPDLSDRSSPPTSSTSSTG